MAIPGQRKPGSKGGFGGMASNRARSLGRGGSPSKGGGGGGKKGCAVLAIAFLSLPVATAAFVIERFIG